MPIYYGIFYSVIYFIDPLIPRKHNCIGGSFNSLLYKWVNKNEINTYEKQ